MNRRNHFALLHLLVALLAFLTFFALAAKAERQQVFISDLHLGIGRDENKQWFPEEDSRWSAEFIAFLDAVDEMGKVETDLILNGDTFELWQSIGNDCIYESRNYGCTEPEALNRLRRVASQHGKELSALGRFASRSTNRVYIVPGNHDAALLFPLVAKEVLTAIGGVPGRTTVEASGNWVSKDGRVYAEHGHQIGNDVNAFKGWPKPFLDESGRLHLQKPWGEQFVQGYYNRFEKKFPTIDNITQESEAIRLGMAAAGPAHTAAEAGAFAKFFVTDVSFDQFRQVLADKKAADPQWDIKAIRQKLTDKFILESFPADDPIRAELAAQLASPASAQWISQLSDEEMLAICDRRALLREAGRNVEECPQEAPALGAIRESMVEFIYKRAVEDKFRNHLRGALSDLRAANRANRAFDVFVYSHTHRADPGFTVPISNDVRVRVVNTGAWQRVISPTTLQAILKRDKVADNGALDHLTFERMLECYSFVRVAADTGRTVAALKFWRKNNAGKWIIADQCENG